jgi:hypothetical protein
MLDCETPLGQTFISHQYDTQKILEGKGYTLMNMSSKDSHADVIIAKNIDGVLTVCGVAEIKSRKMAGDKPLTREYLKAGGYLITREKLDYGSQCAFLFGVPYYLIVNLLSEKVILIWKVTNDQGLFEFDFDTRETSTKMTCNGGEIVRKNAYLPVDKAFCIEY